MPRRVGKYVSGYMRSADRSKPMLKAKKYILYSINPVVFWPVSGYS